MWGAYFGMGAYKRDVAGVIKWVPIFIGCLFSMGAYYPDFTVLYSLGQYGARIVTYSSVVKLWFTLRASARAVAPDSSILFLPRL